MSPWTRSLRRTAWVAGVFSAIVFAALVVNAIAVRSADPTPPTQVDELVTRLNQDPANAELLAEIRRQDVWIREVYGRSERFAQLGFLLLLGGVSAWLLSLKGARHLEASAPRPDPEAPLRAIEQKAGAQQGVLALGLVLGGVLVVVTILSRHDAVNAYVLDSRMPEVAPAARGAAAAGGGAPPIAGLPPIGAAGAPAPGAPGALPGTLPGTLPLSPGAVPGGTELQPLPTSPGGASAAPVPVPPPSPTAIGPVPSASGSWAAFRGFGAGSAEGTLPGAWNAAKGEGVVWKADVPLPGWGSPVLWGGLVFLSGADEKTRELYAFDARNGKLAWRTPVPVLNRQFQASNDAGHAPQTAAVDARHVVASFVNGDVAGFDHAGKRLWSRTFGPMVNDYGYASCPVLVDGKAILQLDQGHSPDEGKSLLVALDPATGKTLWQVRRPVSASWSTPVAARIDGKAAVIVCGNPFVAAYGVADGKELWRAEGMGGEVAPSATFGEGCVFVAQSGAQAMALRATDGKPVWTNYELALPDISSPAYLDGILYFASSDGTLTALDAKSGQIVWEKGLGKPARSSPLIAGGKLLLFDNEGTGRIVQTGRTFKLLGSHPLGDTVSASPALVGGRLYVRTASKLYCLGVR